MHSEYSFKKKSNENVYLYIFQIFLVGYTMSDIRYKWNDGLNSVQISSDVSLPQFKVLGHRQKTIEASLSTGGSEIHLKYSLIKMNFNSRKNRYFILLLKLNYVLLYCGCHKEDFWKGKSYNLNNVELCIIHKYNVVIVDC